MKQRLADDIPLEVPKGDFIINAPAVEYAGSEDISKMLTENYEKAGQGLTNLENYYNTK